MSTSPPDLGAASHIRTATVGLDKIRICVVDDQSYTTADGCAYRLRGVFGNRTLMGDAVGPNRSKSKLESLNFPTCSARKGRSTGRRVPTNTTSLQLDRKVEISYKQTLDHKVEIYEPSENRTTVSRRGAKWGGREATNSLHTIERDGCVR